MPHMSGLELAKAIWGRWQYKPPLLIAVTGFGATEDRQRASEAGIDFHPGPAATKRLSGKTFQGNQAVFLSFLGYLNLAC